MLLLVLVLLVVLVAVVLVAGPKLLLVWRQARGTGPYRDRAATLEGGGGSHLSRRP